MRTFLRTADGVAIDSVYEPGGVVYDPGKVVYESAGEGSRKGSGMRSPVIPRGSFS